MRTTNLICRYYSIVERSKELSKRRSEEALKADERIIFLSGFQQKERRGVWGEFQAPHTVSEESLNLSEREALKCASS